MNEAQRLAIKNRQRKQVAEMTSGTAGFAPPEPPPPQEPFEDLVARARERVDEILDPGGARRQVSYLRFTDKTFQLPGMQSGEQLAAARKNNGQEHAIELVTVGGTGCFLVWYLDPPRREVRHEFVERSAVKTWRLA
jgi:hypothetical protein